MDFFRKIKKYGEIGRIACPGDFCPQNCDETCPIYINTLAIGLLQMGETIKVISLYKKALEIASDF